jgi:hypothetical protein
MQHDFHTKVKASMSTPAPPHPRPYWILQTSTDSDKISQLNNGESRLEWIAKGSEIKSTDRVFLWSRDSEEIYGTGRIIEKDTEKFSTFEKAEPDRVTVRLAEVIKDGNTIKRQQLETIIPIGRDGKVFDDPWQAIKLTSEQTLKLLEMMQSKTTEVINSSPFLGNPLESLESLEAEKPQRPANFTEKAELKAEEIVSDAAMEDLEIDLQPRISGFHADISTDTDLLGIKGDVEAFAKLIAARSIEPPLSIGLFGDWGSGKTFFMRQLKNRVEEIAKGSEDSHIAQKDIAFYKRIVQIEFNAWHYSESNLWASLVEHIFQNLRVNKDDDEQTVKERQEALLKKLEIESAAQLHAQAKEQEAQEKLQQKERELAAVENQHDHELKQLEKVSGEDIITSVRTSLELTPEVKEQIKKTVNEAGIEVIGDAAGDFQEALSQASALLNRVSNIILPFGSAKDRRKRFIMLLLVLLAAPVIGLLVRWLTSHMNLSASYAMFSAVATFLTTGAAWIRNQVERLSGLVSKVEKAKQEVDKKIEAQISERKAKQAKEIARHREELELLRTKYRALRQEREAAERRVDEIREEIRQSTAAQLLGKFIQDRASSDDYRKHLGLLALIRRDFEKLSNLLDQDNKALLSMDWQNEQTDKISRINRIVLYIDDLDRCQPAQVVAVLQAVHLLLAFKLFIVVVGVDCRWVTQSLRKHYPELLRDVAPAKERFSNAGKESENRVSNYQTATSRDYLEKIFQIPFWLNPMTPGSTVSLLKGILGTSVVKDAIEPASSRDLQTHENLPAPQPPDVQSRSLDSGSQSSALETIKPEEGKPASTPISLVKFDLNPKSLDLRERELKFMQALAPILGRSPRSVKRFINIYRLIKVSLSPQQQGDFLKLKSPISQFQAVMLLLVIETGLPTISGEVFSVLQSDFKRRNPNSSFDGLLNHLVGNDINQSDEVERLQRWLKTSGYDGFANLDLDYLAPWASLISRYSFNTERT